MLRKTLRALRGDRVYYYPADTDGLDFAFYGSFRVYGTPDDEQIAAYAAQREGVPPEDIAFFYERDTDAALLAA